MLSGRVTIIVGIVQADRMKDLAVVVVPNIQSIVKLLAEICAGPRMV